VLVILKSEAILCFVCVLMMLVNALFQEDEHEGGCNSAPAAKKSRKLGMVFSLRVCFDDLDSKPNQVR
jgi:hypothetical protein